MSAQTTVTLLKWYHGMRSMLFVLPILTIYYDVYKNVNIEGVFITESFFAIGCLIMAVPAGYLSDIWKRKYVLALGGLFSSLGFTIEWLNVGLWWMIMGELFVGFGFAMGTGTLTAIAYDTFQEMGKTDEHRKFQSDLQIIHTICIGVSAVVGSWLYAWHPDLPMALMALFCFVGLFFALFMREPKFRKEKAEIHPVRDMLETIKYTAHGHKEVACLILLAVVVFTMTKLGFWLHQPYYAAVGLPEVHFGLMFAIGSIFAVLGAHMAKYEGSISAKVSIGVLVVSPAVLYGLAAVLGNMYGLAFIALVTFVYGYGKPVLDHAVNERVSSKRRGAINGAKSMFIHLAFIATAWAVGKMTNGVGVFLSLEILVGIYTLLSLFVLYCLKKHKVV